jgi:hypothetical protein
MSGLYPIAAGTIEDLKGPAHWSCRAPHGYGPTCSWEVPMKAGMNGGRVMQEAVVPL